MRRYLWAAAVGGLAGTATADDAAVNLGRFQPPSASTVATPADTERVFHRRAWPVVAYSPVYYPAFNYGYVGGWYGGYSSFYSPGFAVSYYSAPVYSGWAYPGWYGGGYGFGYGYGFGGFYPIADREDATPAVRLGAAAAVSPVLTAAPEPRPTVRPDAAAPSFPVGGTFRYDGGPASPVPLPAPDAAQTKGEPVGVRVGMPAKALEHRYVGYGEKR